MESRFFKSEYCRGIHCRINSVSFSDYGGMAQMQIARFVYILCFGAELILWFLLGKTYSRGAFVAAVMCTLVCSVFFLLCRASKRNNIFRSLAIKAALITIVILPTGFFARISPDYVKGDASISARTTLWQGGMKMISQAPLRGWGYGKSGEEYINWYQDLDDE